MVSDMSTLHSGSSAQEVLEALIHFAKNQPNDWYALEMVSYRGGEESIEPILAIMLEEGGAKTTLADGSEILHCITDDGRKVSIVLGLPAARGINTAQILVQPE